MTHILRTMAAMLLLVTFGGSLMTGQDSVAAEIKEDGGIRDHSDPDASKRIHSREIAGLAVRFWLWDEAGGQGSSYVCEIGKSNDAVFFLTMSGGAKGSVRVDAAFLGKLQQLIEQHGLVRLNGISQTTSGLPVEFSPCSLTVDYASGERLYFCLDNDPEAEWAKAMRRLFLQALAEGA